jgi:hypothetical protein
MGLVVPVVKTIRRQARFHCAFCGEVFADHQSHVHLLTGTRGVRKAHRACADQWLRRARGPFVTQKIPIIDGRER